MKTIMLIFMFFVIGALFIISENKLKIGGEQEMKSFSSLYFSWLDSTFDNIRTVTGNIVKLNWLPSNSTR